VNSLVRVRVELPAHLRALAGVEGEVVLGVAPPPTIGSVLDSLEGVHPVLRGTIRPHGAEHRRPLIRFYAGGEDLSLLPLDTPIPTEVASGREPFLVVGAIAGG